MGTVTESEMTYDSVTNSLQLKCLGCGKFYDPLPPNIECGFCWVCTPYLKDGSNVNHPSHYNSGKIEVIEAIEDWGMNYHRGNAIKYIARAGKKNAAKEVEDLQKAVWYLKRDIERLEAKKEGREITRPNDMNERTK